MASGFEFFATCPGGFEHLLAGELAAMGVPGVRPLRGQVAFAGTLEDAYRACLWSRLASRVVVVLAHAPARDSDELYQSLNDLPWEDHVALASSFAVDAHGSNAALRNTQFVALRAKDAICDRLQSKLGGRPGVEPRNPDVCVVVRLRGERLTCGIDLSGAPLFRRGSARRPGEDDLGGLRPDYAAALLAAGEWYRCCRRERPTLALAYSGGGSVLVEAVGAALDRAPGLLRSRWGFERWLGHNAEAWGRLLDEADDRAERGAERAGSLRLVTVDPRPGAATAARQALRTSGLDVNPATMRQTSGVPGALAGAEPAASLAVADLSWLGAGEQAREVAAFGLVDNVVSAMPEGSGLVALATGDTLDAALGLAPRATHDVLVGRDEASIRAYELRREAAEDGTGEAPAARASVTLKDGTKVPVLVAASDQFAARLQKVARLRAKWARREGVTCYRVYDADLPDYAVAIDLYQASELARGPETGGRWLVVQEYAAPKGIDPELAHRRLLDVLAIAPACSTWTPRT